MSISKDALIKSSRLLLKPFVRFCMRHSLKLSDLIEVAKAVFVELAEEELNNSNKSVSDSRVSIITGVHRKDVARLRRTSDEIEPGLDLASKVLGKWQNDPKYTTKNGRPRTLDVTGKESEFAELVKSVSHEINPYTVLYELERSGAVERTSRGLRIASRVFIPKGNITQGFKLAADDMDDLVQTVEENLTQNPKPANLHIKTEYDNVPISAEKEIRKWFYKEGSAFHQRARNYLARFDRDLGNKKNKEVGKLRIAVGSFSRIEELNNEFDA